VQLQQLRYVVRVAEEGQFTRAAARLHVAQPSVSSAVAALESELGAALFHRQRGEVTLTAAGEAFLPWARQVLSDCEAGRAAVRDVAGLRRGRLALGATPSLMTNVVPPVLAAYHRAHPSVELSLHQAGSRDLVGHLEAGRLDLALIILPVRGDWVETIPLLVEDLVLAVHRGHRLATASSIEVADLRDLPLVMFRDGYDLRQTTESACRRAGFEPTMVAHGLEMDAALALVAAGMGATVVPASVVAGSKGIVAVPFGRERLSRRVGLAARRDRPWPPAARAFVDQLRAALKARADDDPADHSRSGREPLGRKGKEP
jgi:DNA-binding transcriptional LysR family regulator